MNPRAFVLLLALLVQGCVSGALPRTPSSEPGATGDPQEGSSLLVPPGFGTLLQDDITLRLQRGDLLIKVTPLEEWVIRLTAPDTYHRLRGLAQAHGSRAAGSLPADEAALFLVSLFSHRPDVTYEPEDLLLVNRGLRFRPSGIAAITPAWGTQRLAQQETRMAVYAFDGPMDLQRDLVVEYQELRNEVWADRTVPALEAERVKARARAGGQ
ncbi:hypothetical protein ACFL5A_03495 [Gemmatimonadota bacterium]